MTSDFSQNNSYATGTGNEVTRPIEIVQSYLSALNEARLADAMGILHEHVVYTNVSMPTIRGRHRVAKFLSIFSKDGVDFGVTTHRIAGNGRVVLTERDDAITIGRFRLQFWVCGVFEVTDGQITLWRDYFDYFDMFKATGRAIVGAIVPALRPRFTAR